MDRTTKALIAVLVVVIVVSSPIFYLCAQQFVSNGKSENNNSGSKTTPEESGQDDIWYVPVPDDTPVVVDSDGDGIDDNSDQLPYDGDNDGYSDDVDLYPAGDVGFVFSISKFKLVDQVDMFSDNGQIFLTLVVDGQSVGRLDNGGEAWSATVNVAKSVSETFRVNVEDDQQYVSITLTMYDEDGWDDNDVLDIDGTSSGRSLDLMYDVVSNSWSGDDDGVGYGSEDGTASEDDDDAAVWYDITRVVMPQTKTYSWTYGGSSFSLTAAITAGDYARYKSMSVTRAYDALAMSYLVTPEDSNIKSVASKLNSIANNHGMSDVETLNLALTFVQSLRYAHDNETAGADEYYRFPIETLYDEVGDCEDTSILYASIVEAMGYDAVLLVYPGHAATGVATGVGEYVDYGGTPYYFCETTSDRQVGDMPMKFEGVYPTYVIQV